MATPTSIPQSPTNVDIILAFTRLETKVDTYAKQVADHETRIRALETRRWPLPAVAALSSVIAAGISAVALLVGGIPT